MATPTATPSALSMKRCKKCGKDVNGQRRMKDAKGNYWCYECGSADEASKGSGTLVQPCPVCDKPIHAMNMVRNKKSGVYMCDDCAAAGKKSSGNSDSPDSKKKIQLFLVGLLFAGCGFVYWWMNSKPQ